MSAPPLSLCASALLGADPQRAGAVSSPLQAPRCPRSRDHRQERIDSGASPRLLADALDGEDAVLVTLDPVDVMDKAWELGVEILQGEQIAQRSEEHTSELQSLRHLVCRLLL